MGTLHDIFSTAWPVAAAGGAALAAGVLAHGTFWPGSSFWGPVLSRAPFAFPSGVSLTFDDGPTPGATDRILDALGKLGVKAAFFVVGRNVIQHPGLVRRIDAEGHIVANHTLDHSHFGLFRRDLYWQRQVEMADRAIQDVIGRRPAFFRPPMGMKTAHIARAAAGAGHTVITWTRRAFDGIGTSPGHIVRRLGPSAQPGDILLLHDGLEPHAFRRDAGPTVAALRPLVAMLRERGLEPRPLDELLGAAAYRGDGSSSLGLDSSPAKAGLIGVSQTPECR